MYNNNYDLYFVGLKEIVSKEDFVNFSHLEGEAITTKNVANFKASLEWLNVKKVSVSDNDGYNTYFYNNEGYAEIYGKEFYQVRVYVYYGSKSKVADADVKNVRVVSLQDLELLAKNVDFEPKVHKCYVGRYKHNVGIGKGYHYCKNSNKAYYAKTVGLMEDAIAYSETKANINVKAINTLRYNLQKFKHSESKKLDWYFKEYAKSCPNNWKSHRKQQYREV